MGDHGSPWKGETEQILQVDCGWGGDKNRRDPVGRKKCGKRWLEVGNIGGVEVNPV